ncbi:MAG: M20/M25/M40 family metallo-hydrolase [bacterium]|nr:M20/M25/M40 family metallo-hydrolase [bacterium]
MLGKSLIRKNKRRARAALYLGPVVVLALVWLITENAGRLDPAMSWHGVNFAKHESVQLLQEYLSIDSSYPDGNEIPAAEFLARILEAEDIPVHIERLGQRNANLWAILEGEDPRALVLHSHLDVEPAPNPEGWIHPPFSGKLDPPFVYGRGAFDMKSIAIAQLMSMLELRRSGAELERSLILLATGDEERYSRLGTRRLIREHPELLARFWAVLTEGGAVEATDLTSVKYWGTEFGQKRFVDVWVCDESRERLKALREELLARRAPSRTPPGQVVRFLTIYSASRDNPVYRRLLRHPEKMVARARFPSLPPYIQAMARNEIVAFPVEESAEGGYSMRLILHLLPDEDLEEGWSQLIPGGLSNVEYVVDVPHEPIEASPLDHPVFLEIETFMAEVLPEVTHGPLFLPWAATDARFFRQQGIPSYGYSPFWIISSDTIKMKGRNERMPVPPFLEGVERYVKLVSRLVS